MEITRREFDELMTRIARLEKRNQELEQRNHELEERNRELESKCRLLEAEICRLKKNSRTSSKPPSSDSPGSSGNSNSGKGRKKKKGKPGAKSGHKKNSRPPFDVVDQYEFHELSSCPVCGGNLISVTGSELNRIQQVELVEQPVIVTEHEAGEYWCENCRCYHSAKLPAEVQRGGLFGPRLTALAGWLKGACHSSYTTVKRLIGSVLGIKVSRGFLAKAVQKCSQSLESAWCNLRDLLKHTPLVNVDETGHKENGERMWTWCFRTELYCLFLVDGSRGSNVLLETLGAEFKGAIGCDFFSAYRKYMGDVGIEVQFCIAHLIRELRYLTTLKDVAASRYGERLLTEVKELFYIIKDRESLGDERLQDALESQSMVILNTACNDVPYNREAQNIYQRFLAYGESYFRFITTPGMEPTNNIAERAIRFVVIDRHVTQGTRSSKGRKWCERIWTVLATCKIQSRSSFQFLVDSVTAHFSGNSPPPLIPAKN